MNPILEKMKINKEERQRLHRNFIVENKTTLMILDILMVVAFLMNFGAIAVTDYMINASEYKVAEDLGQIVEYEEVNPVTSAIHDFKPAPLNHIVLRILTIMFKQALLLSLLATCYIYYRHIIHSKIELLLLAFFVIFYLNILGGDFFHNIGMLAAKIKCGG